nr:hypothetical protein [Leptospira alexanderi]
MEWSTRSTDQIDHFREERIKRIILKGPISNGYPNELWSTYRVSEIIRKEFGVTYHQDYVGILLTSIRIFVSKT